MVRKLILVILASLLLAFALASLCRFFFSDVTPYAPGEDELLSWRRQIAFLMTAAALISAEISGIFAIVLVARLLKRHSPPKTSSNG